jgi:1,4-alpha-glucan branching enzyme
MGEEWASKRPFAFFCDFEPRLRAAVREGRRREFAHFPEFQDEGARDRIPDPTALSTFEMSRIDWSEPRQDAHATWLARYRRLIEIRTREIVPRLAGMPPYAGTFEVLGPSAVRVEWRLGDGSRLALLANFSERQASGSLPEGKLMYSSARTPGTPFSATFFLSEPPSQPASPLPR